MYGGQSTSCLAHHGHSTAQAQATNRQTNLSQAETVLFSTLINAVGDLPELDFLRGLIKQKNRTITELQSELDMLKADFQDFRKQFEDRGEEDEATPAEKEKTKEKEEGQITKPMPVKREIIVEEAEASGQSQGNTNAEMEEPLANNTNDEEAPAEPFDWPAEQFIDAGIPEAEKKRVIIGDSLAQALLGVLPGSELVLIKPEEGNAEIIRSLIALPGRVRAVIVFTGRDALLAGDTVASILERFGRLWTLLSRFPAKIFWVPPPYVRQKAVEHADLVTNMRQKIAPSALVGTTASGRSIFELWRFGDSFNQHNVTPTGMPTLNGQKALRAWLFTQAPEFPGDRQMHHPLTNEPARARASTSASKPKPNPKPFRHPAPRYDHHRPAAAGNNYHRDRRLYVHRPAADEYSSRSRSPRERDYPSPSPPIEVWSQEHNFLPSLPSPSFQSRFHRQ